MKNIKEWYLKQLHDETKRKLEKFMNEIKPEKNRPRDYLVELLADFYQSKEKLLEYLLGGGVINLKDSELKTILREGRDNAKAKKPSEDWESYEYEDLSDALDDLLEYLDPIGFKKRGKDFKKLIVNTETPSEFEILLDNIEMCYRFKLYGPTVIFCRSILEVGLEKQLVSKNIDLTQEEGKGYLESMIDLCCKHSLINNETTQKAHSIRKKANDILHKSEYCSQEEAFKIIDDTINILEQVYQ